MTTADFIDVGTSLDLSEALMMSVIVGSSSFLASLMIQVGIGSNVQLFEGDLHNYDLPYLLLLCCGLKKTKS